MSVSSELLCSFELLKPLDSNALKSHIKKGRNKRQQMLNSPVCWHTVFYYILAPVPANTVCSLQMCILKASRSIHGGGVGVQKRERKRTMQITWTHCADDDSIYNRKLQRPLSFVPVEG